MPGQDRLSALCEQDPATVTGIDFIQVVDPHDQTLLRVFFLIDPDELAPPIVASGDLPFTTPDGTVSIIAVSGGDTIAEVEVVAATYREVSHAGGLRTVLDVEVAAPGDFSVYRLTVHHPQVDRFFNGVDFSFKQGCPSRFDCREVGECPPDDLVDFPIDYLARDFTSLRGALLDFAAQRYPKWSEKIEADVGVMLAEVMAALGDELSYIQDRHAREAYLETASQRRSLRWHTRLVDYNIHDGLSATTVLALDAGPRPGGAGLFVDAGTLFWARPQGEPAVPFEAGERIADQRAGRRFWIHEAWNAMPAHVPDEAEPCLPIGATELYLRGVLPTDGQLPPDPGADPAPPGDFWIGRWMVLWTTPEDPSLPLRRHLVRIVEVEPTEDPLCPENGSPLPITRIRWEGAQALPFELCLRETVVRGNVVPAVAGETFEENFVVGASDALPGGPSAIEREGPCNELTEERAPVYRHTLAHTTDDGLGWVGELRDADPEVELAELDDDLDVAHLWQYRRSLLIDSTASDRHFTLDDGTWRRIIGFERRGEQIAHADYAVGAGFSVRFGDGEFGRLPAESTVFQARYRTGPGTRANLARDTVVHLDAPPPGLLAVTNPFPVTSGVDPESRDEIVQLAPEAFQALPLRAVRDEDYEEIAERLPWVQQAGATARWTGSWLSEFATADPLGAFSLSAANRAELENTLDCVRQIGREVHVREPRYLNVDLEVHICVAASAYPGQVLERVVRALTRGPEAFFHPDNFSFGVPLRRAELEAAIQAVPGVLAVDEIFIRIRGVTGWRPLSELVLEVGDEQILRLQNDPRFPGRGTLRVAVDGEAPV